MFIKLDGYNTIAEATSFPKKSIMVVKSDSPYSRIYAYKIIPAKTKTSLDKYAESPAQNYRFTTET